MKRTTGLKLISEKRRAKLAAAGVVHPGSTFARKPTAVKPGKRAAKRSAGTDPDAATVDLVCERDDWRCVVCGDPIRGRRGSEWSVHHRKLRSHGVDNRPANLILVCGHGTSLCHGAIHAGPNAAREAGWMVRSTADPAATVMAHSQHGWVLLDNEGGLARVTPPADPMEAPMGASEEF